VFYGVDVRMGFEAEFAIEPAAESVVDLIFLLGSMPDVPLMHITNGWV
jgi:hypothetical protein